MVKETRKIEIENDIYVIIPPISQKIELFIGNIRKGKPVIVTPMKVNEEYKSRVNKGEAEV